MFVSGDSEPCRNENRRRTHDENAAEAGCIVLSAILVHSADEPGTINEDEVHHAFDNDYSTIR